MNPIIAAAMAACLQHMQGGAYERDFEDCDKITVEYNLEVETLTAMPDSIPAFQPEHTRQDDIDTVKSAAATLPN
jgi:hypothetical protein